MKKVKRERKGGSYWTRRRIIKEKANKHMEDFQKMINDISVENTVKSRNAISNNVAPSTNENLYTAATMLCNSNDNNTSCSFSSEDTSSASTGDSFSECSWYSYSASDNSDTEPSIKNSSKNCTENNISNQLADWAVKFNVSHKALQSLLQILCKVFPSLPQDPRTILSTQRTYLLKPIGSGHYYHFGIGKSICDAFKRANEKPIGSVISLHINIDGLPLFKSTKQQLWPILLKIDQQKVNTPFVVGLYAGNNKPESLEIYLDDFIEEMKLLFANGIKLYEQEYSVKILCFICDAPARFFIKKTKGHNAYFGCDKCCQKGVWKEKVVFPETDNMLRTDENFKEMIDHHNGPSITPLSDLQIALVTQFVLDPMHLVHLGVTRRLIRLWMKAPRQSVCRLSSSHLSQISKTLLSFHEFLPREFARKCRSLEEVDRWKATELRQFVLYSGVVALKNYVSSPLYQHFLLYFVGIFCLSSPTLYLTHCDYANSLLVLFVKNFGNFYGNNMLVYNVHCLIHLAADVKRFGPLDSFSAFPSTPVCLNPLHQLKVWSHQSMVIQIPQFIILLLLATKSRI